MNPQLRRYGSYGAIAILIILASLWRHHRPLPPPAGEILTVQAVLSGQTLQAQWRGETLTLRLAGLDVPDRAQAPWGAAAAQALSQKLPPQQTVVFVPSSPERDRYDRQWGYLWHGETFINLWLIEQGYAIAKREPDSPFGAKLSHAQDYARIKGAGIWNPQKPLRQTPNEFRARSANPSPTPSP